VYRTNAPPPPEPPSTLPRWILLVVGFGVLAAVLLLAVGAAVGALFVTARDDDPRDGTPTRSRPTPHAPVQTPAAPAPPVSTSIDPGLEDDAPPSAPAPAGTPLASLAARPAWGKRERLTVNAKEGSQYAPQPANHLELFLAASPLTGSAADARGLVICRFQSFNHHDSFAGDDLHVRVRLGATPEIAHDGPEDANLAFLSAPLVRLTRGEHVGFEVFDRDVFGMTPIASGRVPVTESPLSTTLSGAAIECRILEGEALGHALSARVSAASGALIDLEKAAVLDGARPDWGYPAAALAHAEKQIAEAAAVAGWAEPRVHDRVVRHDAVATDLLARRRQLFDTLHASSGPTVREGSLAVTLREDVSCGTSCVAVRVENVGHVRVDLGSPHTSVYLATPDAGPTPARVDRASAARAGIEPGESVDRTVVSYGSTPGPLLLGVCNDRRCGTLRVR